MSYKELYSETEWKSLVLSPLWVFKAVAGADGKLDKKEIQSVDYLMSNSGFFSCELFREVLEEVGSYEMLNTLGNASELDLKAGLIEAAQVLDTKTDSHIAADFKHGLIALGVFIGMSSGKIFDFNFSPDEEEALTQLGKYLNVNVHGVLKTTVIGDILGKFAK